MNSLLLAVCLLIGLAVTFAIYGGPRLGYLPADAAGYRRQMRETYLRFHPDPINAGAYVLA